MAHVTRGDEAEVYSFDWSRWMAVVRPRSVQASRFLQAHKATHVFEFELENGSGKIVSLEARTDVTVSVTVGSDVGALLDKSEIALPAPFGFSARAYGDGVLVTIRTHRWLPFFAERHWF